MIIQFHKIRPEVRVPTRSNPSDAGLDVYAYFGVEGSYQTVPPNTSAIVPTGLKFGVPHGYMLQVMNRSSVAAKRSLVVGAHVIDKIAQLVMVPVIAFRTIETSCDDLYSGPITISNRGDGALGSTGE